MINNLVIINKNYYIFEFELFIFLSLILMPISKNLTDIYISNSVVKRKLNQYTNWNIFLIFLNYIYINISGNQNPYISKFIAHNSLLINILFHGFMLYDNRILFEKIDNIKPFSRYLTFFHKISDRTLLNYEYIICDILLHILPVYYYYDNIVNYKIYPYDINIYPYTLLFKFMWALNIIKGFNVSSIYVPSLDICNIKIINLIVIMDYTLDKILLSL